MGIRLSVDLGSRQAVLSWDPVKLLIDSVFCAFLTFIKFSYEALTINVCSS